MRHKRSDVNHDTYKLILEQCVQLMRQNAPYADGIDFTLPHWIPGRPVYDTEHALRYLMDKLTFHDYKVTRKGDSTVHVCWRHVKKRPRASPTPPPQAPAPKAGNGAPPLPSAPSVTGDIVQRLKQFNRQAKRIVLR